MPDLILSEPNAIRQFSVRVLKDSLSYINKDAHQHRLTSFQLRYPRFIHAELMTHRAFSRNASSSRAIPVKKIIEQVRTNPAMPIHWGKNQPGMQAYSELPYHKRKMAIRLWRNAANEAADIAEAMDTVGAAKQVANRILEPFQFMHVVLSFTEGNNFYDLRRHHAADPNIRFLADFIYSEHQKSRPQRLVEGDWHLPYVDQDEFDSLDAEYQSVDVRQRGGLYKTNPAEMLRRCSAARCARVSYLNHDGTLPNRVKDLELFDKLVAEPPEHMSPTEHQATPSADAADWSNFHGWKQMRRGLERSRGPRVNWRNESESEYTPLYPQADPAPKASKGRIAR